MMQRVLKEGEPRHEAFEIAPRSGVWNGVSDPAYLLGEIEELRLAAQKGGHGTLAYLLACAAEEARTQARRKADRTA